jgi:hypothetical protein
MHAQVKLLIVSRTSLPTNFTSRRWRYACAQTRGFVRQAMPVHGASLATNVCICETLYLSQ